MCSIISLAKHFHGLNCHGLEYIKPFEKCLDNEISSNNMRSNINIVLTAVENWKVSPFLVVDANIQIESCCACHLFLP